VTALGVDEALELPAVQKNPAALGALVDDDAVTLVAAHLGAALGACEAVPLIHGREL
jgi:hypothetical protein